MIENFCCAPWVHFMINPDGAVTPCCMVHPAFGYSYDNVNNDDFDIEKLVNNEKIKKIRLEFLDNKIPKPCRVCIKHEKTNSSGLREMMNAFWYSDDIIKDTKPDGTYENFVLKYVDIRPSNICNLSCIICNNGYSYGAGLLTDKLSNNSNHAKLLKYKNPNIHIEVYKKYINTIERIMFAGGESTIDKNHLKILNFLIENEKYDIEIIYQTNLQTLYLDGVFLPDLWKKFKYVVVGISIDGCNDVYEYIRYGGKWDKKQKNIKTLSKMPNIEIAFNIVVQAFNINNIPILIKQLEDMQIPIVDLINHCCFPMIFGERFRINLVPKECIDIKAWENLKQKGYDVEHVLNFINSDYSCNQEERDINTTFMKEFKKYSGLDAKNIISYYDKII